MFTATDFLSLTDYFEFLSTDRKTCFEVMSKNSMHYWKIIRKDWGYQLLHAHKLADGYHIHGEYSLLLDCVLDAVEHDEWLLGIWQHKNVGRKKQSHTYFDSLIQKYCVNSAYA